MDEMDHAQALAEADRAGALARRTHAGRIAAARGVNPSRTSSGAGDSLPGYSPGRSHAVICVACGNEIAPADRGETPYCRACEPAREAA